MTEPKAPSFNGVVAKANSANREAFKIAKARASVLSKELGIPIPVTTQHDPETCARPRNCGWPECACSGVVVGPLPAPPEEKTR